MMSCSTFGSFDSAGCSQASSCSTFATMLRCSSVAPFDDAGRAAGVLQERDIIGPELARRERLALAGRERRLELHRLRQRIGRHHLLHLAHDQIDDRALREAEQVAHVGEDDVLHGVLAITFSSVVAKFSRMTIASAPESLSWCSSSRGV